MSHPLVQAQREKADLEQALAWLRGNDATGRREAEIAARAVERELAEIKQRITGELSENGGYVIAWNHGEKVFTAVAGDLWSANLKLAERFPTHELAGTRLRTLQAAFARRDRWKLTVEPLAKLIAIRRGHGTHSPTPTGDQP